jgi:hypothetical protein
MIKRSRTEAGLVALIKENLEYVEESNRKGRLYAGDNVCHRMNAILSQNKSTVKIESTMIPYTEVGIAMEKLIIRALNKGGVFVANDVRIPELEGIPMGGKIDAIIWWRDRPVIVEVKTASNTIVKEKHRIQAMTYSMFTGLDYIILYINRSIGKPNFGKLTLDTEAHYFAYSEDESLELFKNVCKAAYSSTTGLLDNTDIPYNKTACKSFYCPFIGYCHEGKKLADFKSMPKSEYKKYNAFIEEKTQWFIDNKLAIYTAFCENLNAKKIANKKNRKTVLEYYEKVFGVST